VNLLLGALAVGLIWSLLSLGTFISFRVLRSLDLTTEGAFVAGGAVTCALVTRGVSPVLATAAGGLAGGAAGAVTGFLHGRFRVDVVLAGILVMTGLYSVNYWVMRGGNLSLAGHPTLFDQAKAVAPEFPRDAAAIVMLILLVGGLAAILGAFATTDLGLALRASGSSPRMARATAIDTELATTIGLALANSFTGLSGALFAQYQGSAGVQMGVGMIVSGLASVILGEALFPQRTIQLRIVAAVIGAVALRLLVGAAIRAGLDPTALKLVTAAFVLAALTVPGAVRRLRRRRTASHA
jgi:putative tryptophan/tyrosine transport system permease protein